MPPHRRAKSAIVVLRSGNTVTVSDGTRTRQSVCATVSAAKGQETRLKNDTAMAARWLVAFEPVQLTLPLLDPELDETPVGTSTS